MDAQRDSQRWRVWGERLLGVLLALWMVGGVLPAWGQVDLLGGDAAPGSGQSGAVEPLAPIQIELDSFGLGNLARPGDWCAVRLTITEQTQQRREVIVRLSMLDGDGDEAEYRTVLSTNPGVRQPVTLFVRLPVSFAGDFGPVVSVYQAEEDTVSGRPGALGYREGALITQTRLPQPMVGAAVLDAAQGAMLVIGDRAVGLEAYGRPHQNEPFLAFGHELTRLAMGVRPAMLPDRWHGLAPFSEIIWTEGSPLDLGLEQARALREWVQRGGHLVIVLPVVGNEWVSVQNQEVNALLPRVSIERRERQPVEAYAPMLAITPDVVLRRPLTVHMLEPLAEAEPTDAMRILNNADGRCVVARRLVGLGAVTLIGIDLLALAPTRGQFEMGNTVPPTSASPGLPEADVFWHRVLGRRGALLSPAGTTAWQGRPNSPTLGARTATWIDADLGDRINRTGRAAQGVLLGLVVFALYWLIAGPGGFFALKRKELTRHAWVGFVLAGAVFTGIAWGGAWAIKPKTLTFDHLTFLDHVYGQRQQRSRTIGSLLIPAYGEASVEVGTDEELAVAGRGRFTHLVAPWEPLDGVRRGRVGFPDSRGYAIDSRAPSRLTFPTRATVKQIEMDWFGGMEWSGIRPVALEGEEFGQIRRAEPGQQSLLQGRIEHNLPGSLRNVRVIVIDRQAPLGESMRTGLDRAEPRPNALFAVGMAVTPALVNDQWPPGTPIDMGMLTVRRTAGTTLGATLDRWLPSPQIRLDLGPRPTSGPLEDRFFSLSFYNQLQPPNHRPSATQAATWARRVSSHTMDLSRWFSQPCVIVIGLLDGEGTETCPTPFRVRVNDQIREPRVRGTTVVRWIYPLDEMPPAFTGVLTTTEESSTPDPTEPP